MRAFILLMLASCAVAMPVYSVGYASPVVAHAPTYAYSQPIVKQVVSPVAYHAPQVAYHAPQVAYHAPQVAYHAPVVKAVAPAASSYASFSQVHVSHPSPIVKVAQPVAYAQPVVKVAQPVAYAQPIHSYYH